MKLLYILLAWIVLSIPVAIVVGKFLKRAREEDEKFMQRWQRAEEEEEALQAPKDYPQRED